MTNHHRPPQKTQLLPFFSESLTLQGFQTAKNTIFSAFLPHFIFELKDFRWSVFGIKTTFILISSYFYFLEIMEVIIRPKPIPMSVNATIPKGYVFI